jgi:hypothetical protein
MWANSGETQYWRAGSVYLKLGQPNRSYSESLTPSHQSEPAMLIGGGARGTQSIPREDISGYASELHLANLGRTARRGAKVKLYTFMATPDLAGTEFLGDSWAAWRMIARLIDGDAAAERPNSWHDIGKLPQTQRAAELLAARGVNEIRRPQNQYRLKSKT